MMFYWKKDYKRSLAIFDKGTTSINKNYPNTFKAKYYKWMGDVARTAYATKIGKGEVLYSKNSFVAATEYYKKSMEFGNASDTSFLLNFSSFLKKGNCKKASDALINTAKKMGGLSQYAIEKVIPNIEKMKAQINYCEG